MQLTEDVTRALAWCSIVSLCAVFACGARSGIPYDDPTGGARADDVEPPAQPAPGPPPTPRDRPLFESKPLSSCEPGVPANQADVCSWVADGLCYDTQDAACACVCPRSGNVWCQAGLFENHFGALEVDCWQR